MTVLFVLRHPGYVRNFEWVLRLLAERGHRVHLGFQPKKAARWSPGFPERLQRETAGAITYGDVPLRDDVWRPLVYGLRESVSYLRYLTPAYRHATKLRERWALRTPGIARAATRLPLLRTRRGLRLLELILSSWEARLPPPRAIVRHLGRTRPDVLLVTPLVDGPSQQDWVRAARAEGIPACFAVHSWDNLTNKGLAHARPDRTYVWNEIQRREAVELHGFPPESVVAVGAHSFDHWFRWRPSTTRHEFCARIGLDPDSPLLLYVCSSGFIAPDEPDFVAAWLEAIRADSTLAAASVLIRPHPTGAAVLWENSPLAKAANVAVWPARGAEPRDDQARSDYYDSLHQAVAVVGLNTTALVEAAIVGRRTYTVVLPERDAGQEQTLHFHYLVHENGGPLVVARSLEEHAAHLRQALEGRAEESGWQRSFLESFIRPGGLEQPAAPRLADDLLDFWASFEPAGTRRSHAVARALSLPAAWAALAGRATRRMLHKQAAWKSMRKSFRRLIRQLRRLRRRARGSLGSAVRRTARAISRRGAAGSRETGDS